MDQKPEVTDDVVSAFTRLETNTACPDDLATVIDWAEHEPQKLDQFEQLARLWQSVGEVTPNEKLFVDEPKNLSVRNRSRRWYLPAAIAACLSCVALFMAFERPPDALQSYQTQRGELRQITLDDGSRVALNGLSQVSIEFDKQRRHIQLQRGEAYFEIARDSNRAFVVAINNVKVRVLGTAFNVDVLPQQLDISVTHGVVEIALPGAAALRAVKGEQVSLSLDSSGTVASTTMRKLDDIDQVYSWRQNMLRLNGESLQSAIEKINRQSSRHIVAVDDSIKEFAVYGAFDLTNVESFLNAMEALYPIHRVETDQGVALFHNTQ